MSSLILFLPPARPGPTTEYSYTLTADGHSAVRHGVAAAPLLPDPPRPGGEVVAVVPAQALSWQRVQLPAGLALGAGQQTPRLRSVIEGLLEERVLDDVSQLHFALAPAARAGEPLWVAVCDRAWLRESLQVLEAAGRRVARVVPEFAPGSTASGLPELCALGTPEDAHIVITGQGEHQAVVVMPLGPIALPLARAGMVAHSGTHAALADDSTLTVRAEPAVAALAERTLGQQVTLQTASERAMAAARGGWDLAQFDLASTGRTRALRKAGSAASALLQAPQWRAARWGGALLVVAHLVGLNAWAWQERAALVAKQNQVRAALTQTFPKVQVIVDAPVQMERELTQLRQATGSVSARDLEPLLSAAGVALGMQASAQPSGIEYTPGELRLRGITLGPEEQSALVARLQTAGYSMRLDDGALVLRSEGLPP